MHGHGRLKNRQEGLAYNSLFDNNKQKNLAGSILRNTVWLEKY